ncbi:hypothetical protein MKK88_10955 [Methylobacterium sp. E-005]|uniref:hypothetical protein n=1 Tax=Methylobacterium sp. E-005 TaxID=2836549 RepID=UPI001FBA0AC8|nr:hypothetical protein [Methylobacterium sp. E-005]MCJ2086505.1 hypothetical protein [Methylobacterium sp. E-005]
MRAFNDIAPYSVGQAGLGYAVFLTGQIIESGFDCRAAAVYHAHDLLDAQEEADEAEAEETRRIEAEMRADEAALLAEIGEAA